MILRPSRDCLAHLMNSRDGPASLTPFVFGLTAAGVAGLTTAETGLTTDAAVGRAVVGVVAAGVLAAPTVVQPAPGGCEVYSSAIEFHTNSMPLTAAKSAYPLLLAAGAAP